MNKYYDLNIYKSNLEIEIKFLPKDNFNKNKLYYDLILFYEINEIIIIKYKNIIIINKNELKNLIFNNQYIKRIYFTSVRLDYLKFSQKLVNDFELFVESNNISLVIARK